jgi:hypothetical protein
MQTAPEVRDYLLDDSNLQFEIAVVSHSFQVMHILDVDCSLRITLGKAKACSNEQVPFLDMLVDRDKRLQGRELVDMDGLLR